MFKKRIEKAVSQIEDGLFEKVDRKFNSRIKKICRELVFEIFTDTREKVYGESIFHRMVPTIRAEMTKLILDSVRERLAEMCESEVRKIIEGEAFIDSVVDRIKTKQLGVFK